MHYVYNSFVVKYFADSESVASIPELPQPGSFYNAKGCRHGAKCVKLHICRDYLIGDCKFGDTCTRSHDLLDAHPQAVLIKCGVDVRRPIQEIRQQLSGTKTITHCVDISEDEAASGIEFLDFLYF